VVNKQWRYIGVWINIFIVYVSLGRPRRRWEDNIKMNLQEVEWRGSSNVIDLRIRTDGGLL
jgi:hypothetical protein